MQVLYLKEKAGKNEKGEETYKDKKVFVIRSWSNSSGIQIYLHASGLYGYKNGDPIRSADELPPDMDPIHRKMAQKWWNIRGRKLSEEFYAKRQAELERNIDIGQATVERTTDLDHAYYRRKPIDKRGNFSFSEPQSWFEYNFPERPAWWGLLFEAKDAKFLYKIANPEAVGLVPQEDEEDETNEKASNG